MEFALGVVGLGIVVAVVQSFGVIALAGWLSWQVVRRRPTHRVSGHCCSQGWPKEFGSAD